MPKANVTDTPTRPKFTMRHLAPDLEMQWQVQPTDGPTPELSTDTVELLLEHDVIGTRLGSNALGSYGGRSAVLEFGLLQAVAHDEWRRMVVEITELIRWSQTLPEGTRWELAPAVRQPAAAKANTGQQEGTDQA